MSFPVQEKPDNVSAVTSLRQAEFLKPRYWPMWVGIALIRNICLLPNRARWSFGSALGFLAYHLAHRRRHIVETNLRLCFPELNAAQHKALVRDNFKSSGISIMETALVWFFPPEKFRSMVDVEGLELLKEAEQRGQGVMLMGMHLSSLDFCGAVLANVAPFDVMYRKNKNRLLEAVMTRGRERNFKSAIERNNVRQVIRRLRQGAVVWYGPDQDYGRQHSVFAPFFGVTSATITAPARILKMTGAPVILFSHYRNLETGRYRIVLSSVTASYPTGEEEADARTINQLVENAVSVAPEQYWWLHRRFKTRPDGEAKLY